MENPEVEFDGMSGGGKTESFFSYLFSLNPTEKTELVNLLQYILLAIIPVVILLKLMKTYLPPENPKKASLEILVEVVVQLSILFSAFWFINKMIVFLPTYSGSPYPKLNVTQMVIPVLFILVSMKTSLSEKLSFLLQRVMVLVGLTKETMRSKDDDESDDEDTTRIPNSNASMMQMLPPPISTSTVASNQPQIYGQPSMSNHSGNSNHSNMNQTYGISEPMAANESGGYMNF